MDSGGVSARGIVAKMEGTATTNNFGFLQPASTLPEGE
jgi:hypothetical protein